MPLYNAIKLQCDNIIVLLGVKIVDTKLMSTFGLYSNTDSYRNWEMINLKYPVCMYVHDIIYIL